MQFLKWRLKWFTMRTQKIRSEHKEKEKEEENEVVVEEKEEEEEEEKEEKEVEREGEVPGVVTTAAIGKPLAIPFAMVTVQQNTSSQQYSTHTFSSF